MLFGLKLWNFPSGALPNEEIMTHAFVLRTCQRTMVLSFDFPFLHRRLPRHELVTGREAYLFLLETICGLKSKLIGENEIVGQFKQAYQLYASTTLRETNVLQVLEKLFKDAKNIRTQYLIGISQKTYASLTRKHLVQRGKADHIAIIGSGALAEDLINQFKKKAQVFLCARNAQRVLALKASHAIETIAWDDRQTLMNFPFIANTVGANTILFDDQFFQQWSQQSQKMFVDLGSPSTIVTDLNLSEGVVRLADIFLEGAIVEEQKENQISLAKAAMVELTARREDLFNQKFNRSTELLAPQNVSAVRYL